MAQTDVLIEKLSETGIKLVDLVNKGIDNLPQATETLIEIICFKYRLQGCMCLLGGFLLLVIGIIVFFYGFKKFKNADDDIDTKAFGIILMGGSLAPLIISSFLFFNWRYWYMVFVPKGYLVIEIMEKFLK